MKRFNNNPDHFQFAIVSDRYSGVRPGVFERAIDKLNLLQPEFVLCIGDLVPGDTNVENVAEKQWSDFDAIVNRLEMPFFRMTGNHDLTPPYMRDRWVQRYGPTYYHFVYKNVLYLILDSEDPWSNHLGDQQVAYIRKVLNENRQVRWTFVFLHRPLWTIGTGTNWEAAEAALKNRPYTVFAGHHHIYTYRVREGREYINLATTGGHSRIRGLDYGEFDHIVWITMTEQGPRIANLLLDGIQDKKIISDEMASILNVLDMKTWLPKSIPPVNINQSGTGATEITFTNPINLPLRIQGSFRPNSDIKPSPPHFDQVIPRLSSKKISLTAQAVDPAATATRFNPLALELHASYIPQNGQPVAKEEGLSIHVDRRMECLRLTGPVTLDGRLTDWRGQTFIDCRALNTNGSPATVSATLPEPTRFRFATAHDDKNLYLAIETFDDKICVSPMRDVLQQDGLRILLDVRPEQDRTRNYKWIFRHDNYLMLAFHPNLQAPTRPAIFEPHRLPKDTRVACIQTSQGIAAEIAVPLAWVRQRQGSGWNSFRLNIGATDQDEPDGRTMISWWQPDWNSEGVYSGSGIILRR